MNLDDLEPLHVLAELESRNDLTNRPNLERLHVLDDLQELDDSKVIAALKKRVTEKRYKP